MTWRGKLALAVLLVVVGWFMAISVHPFLAVTERVPARILVIEGSGSQQPTVVQQAVDEFRSGNYEKAILVRPVLSTDEPYHSGQYSKRHWLVTMLVQYGIPEERLIALFPNVAEKDRTYHSALAVKQWLAEQGLSKQSLNVASQGPHARRSRLLYQKAFGEGGEIGVIALRNLEYEPVHWWRTSEGVREVIGETIAYIYARFLFHQPSDIHR